jgi:hypothetical protein
MFPHIELTYEVAVALFVLCLLAFVLISDKPKKSIQSIKEKKYTDIIQSVDMDKMPPGLKYQQKIEWIMEQNTKLSKRQANTILAQWDRLHYDS